MELDTKQDGRRETVNENQITIERPDTSALSKEYDPLVGQATALVVNSIESHAAALEGYKYIKQAIKRIRELFEPSRKAANEAKNEILRARDGMLAPFETAKGIVDGKIDVYEKEERRKAEEKAALEAEAERVRQEEERIAEAEAAEKAGDDELAEEIIERPIEVAPSAPVTTDTVATVKGVSSSKKYHAEVVDFGALIKYAASAPCNYSLVEPSTTALNAMARQYKDELRIPGVRVVTETVRAVR